jgi:hypothetical protein
MVSNEKSGIYFEFPAILGESAEFRVRLELLVEEFAIKLGTLAEECTKPETRH